MKCAACSDGRQRASGRMSGVGGFCAASNGILTSAAASIGLFHQISIALYSHQMSVANTDNITMEAWRQKTPRHRSHKMNVLQIYADRRERNSHYRYDTMLSIIAQHNGNKCVWYGIFEQQISAKRPCVTDAPRILGPTAFCLPDYYWLIQCHFPFQEKFLPKIILNGGMHEKRAPHKKDYHLPTLILITCLTKGQCLLQDFGLSEVYFIDRTSGAKRARGSTIATDYSSFPDLRWWNAAQDIFSEFFVAPNELAQRVKSQQRQHKNQRGRLYQENDYEFRQSLDSRNSLEFVKNMM